jgi:hypothetical protein
MGQMSAVNRLPENLRNKVIEMLNNPAMTQMDIVNAINAEAGKQFLTRSSMNRFIRRMENLTGEKRGRFIVKTSDVEESLDKISTALERIAFSLEKHYKKTS